MKRVSERHLRFRLAMCDLPGDARDWQITGSAGELLRVDSASLSTWLWVKRHHLVEVS